MARKSLVPLLAAATFGLLHAQTPVFEFHFEAAVCEVHEDSGRNIFDDKVGDFHLGYTFPNIDNSFDCPLVINEEGLEFIPSSNGIRLSGEEAALGVRTMEFLSEEQEGVFQGDFSVEFWLEFRPPDGRAEHTLFELSRVAAGDISAWDGFDGDYDFRIYTQGDRLFVEAFDDEDFPVSVPLGTLSITNELSHILCTYSTAGEVICYENGEVTLTVQEMPSPMRISDNDHVVVLGSSFGATVEGNLVATFGGDIVFVRLLDEVIPPDSVTDLFNAGPPNSPAVAAAFSAEKIEDEPLTIDFSSAVFDADTPLEELKITILELPEAEVGVLSVNGTEITGETEITFFDEVNFTQTVPNQFDASTDFRFSVSDGIADDSLLPGSSTRRFSLDFVESNDPPQAFSNDFESAREATDQVIVLSGFDPLDEEGGNRDFKPKRLIITNVESDEDLGIFRSSCDAAGVELVADSELELQETDVEREGYTLFSVSICYGAQSNEESSDDGLLGTAFISFKVVDGPDEGPFLESEERQLEVRVISGIFAGCRDDDGVESICAEDNDEESFTTDELGDFVEVTLFGFDSRCDGGADDDACEDREKAFSIIGPLPDPELEGSFGFLDENSNVQLITQQMVDNEAQGVLIPGTEGVIRFYRAPNYFNLATYPLCMNNGLAPQGNCQENALPPCEGDFCDEGFTTHNLVEVPIGTCDADSTVLDGCPVRVYYLLKVGEAYSPLPLEGADPTLVIWVRNELPEPDNEEAVAASSSLEYDSEYLVGDVNSFNVISESPNQRPIQILDVDPDVKRMGLEISLAGNQAAMRVSADILGSIHEVGNPQEYRLDYEPQTCFAVGCDFDDGRIKLTGSSSMINQLLEGLAIEVPGERGGQENATATFELQSPFLSAVEFGNLAIRYNILFAAGRFDNIGEECTIFIFNCPRPYVWAIVAAVFFLILMCLISICKTGASYTCFGIRLGQKAVRHLGGNAPVKGHRDKKSNRRLSLESEVEELDAHFKKDIRHEALEIKRAGQISRFMAFICPCCCSLSASERQRILDEGNLDAEVDVLEDIYAQRLHDRVVDKKVPRGRRKDEKNYEQATGEALMEWEVHEKITPEGEKQVYYYNTVTDKSQWHNPFPGESIKKGKPVKVTKSGRKNAKPYSPASKRGVNKSKKSARDGAVVSHREPANRSGSGELVSRRKQGLASSRKARNGPPKPKRNVIPAEKKAPLLKPKPPPGRKLKPKPPPTRKPKIADEDDLDI